MHWFQSITFEYSLRPLGAGGPGMFGAWVLRQSLRAFSEVVEKCNMDELYHSPGLSSYEERGLWSVLYNDLYSCWLKYPGEVLGCFIDKLPEALYDLWKAFDELGLFLLDFVSFFHSIDLTRVLHSLKASLKVCNLVFYSPIQTLTLF